MSASHAVQVHTAPGVRRYRTLPRAARVYVAGVVAAGGVLAAVVIARVGDTPAVTLGTLMIAAALTSAIKAPIPMAGSGSTLSFSYIVNVIALFTLGPLGTVPVAAIGAWSQCTFGSRRRNPAHQTLFSMAVISLTTAAAGWAYTMTLGVPAAGAVQTGAALVAATVYFFMNTALVAAVVALVTRVPAWRVWTRDFLWSGPTYYVGALIAVLAVLVSGQASVVWAAALAVPAVVCYWSYHAYLARITEEHRQVREAADLQMSIVESLALAVEAKDNTALDHLVRMQVYAEGLARELGASDEEARGIRTAALLHDIGNLAVPEHILAKPGLLTPSEHERVRIHPRVGADILARVPFRYPVAEAIAAHHERWDGRGYPDRMAGDAIPLGARILAVADCFTTMLADRPHKPAGSVADAIAAVQEGRGSALDPRLVDVFLRILPRLEAAVPAAMALATAPHPEAQPGQAVAALTDIAAAHTEDDLVRQLSGALTATLDGPGIGQVVAVQLARRLPFESSALYVGGHDGLSLRCAHATGPHASALRRLAAPDVASLRADLTALDLADPAGHASPMDALLIASLQTDDRTVGVIVVCGAAGHRYTSEHQRLLARVATHTAPAVDSMLRLATAQELSLTDPLTNLGNRRAAVRQIEHEVSRASRRAGSLAVLYLDVDRFKHINDTFGHHAGDRALITIGRSLRAGLRDYDTCARMGGDEFVVVLADCGPDGAGRRLRAIQEAVAARPFDAAPGHVVSLRLSGGLATYPHDGQTAEALLAAADRRMYLDKQSNATARTA